jgi:hypothetical protein
MKVDETRIEEKIQFLTAPSPPVFWGGREGLGKGGEEWNNFPHPRNLPNWSEIYRYIFSYWFCIYFFISTPFVPRRLVYESNCWAFAADTKRPLQPKWREKDGTLQHTYRTGVSGKAICRMWLQEVGLEPSREGGKGNKKDAAVWDRERHGILVSLGEVSFMSKRTNWRHIGRSPDPLDGPNEVCAVPGMLRAPTPCTYKTRGPSRWP